MQTIPRILCSVALALSLGAVPAMGLAPSADDAEAALEASPRHGEYAYIAIPGTDVEMATWVVFPERAEKAPVVVVVHEIFGLTDWIRSVADAIAAEGFIAVAPDFIAGMEGAESNPRAAIGRLEDAEVVKRLNLARDHGLSLPAASDAYGVMGFCWGGRVSFMYATEEPGLGAAIVYYGTSPATDSLATIESPVLGLYGEDDARVNATIDDAKNEMARLEKVYEIEMYDGAGHGFLRQQEGRDGANMKASEQAWERTIAFLRKHLEGNG